MPCPICGTEQIAEAVDVMVGYVQVEPYHCPNCYYCEDFDTGEEYREKLKKDFVENETAIHEHNFLNYAYYYPPKGDE